MAVTTHAAGLTTASESSLDTALAGPAARPTSKRPPMIDVTKRLVISDPLEPPEAENAHGSVTRMIGPARRRVRDFGPHLLPVHVWLRRHGVRAATVDWQHNSAHCRPDGPVPIEATDQRVRTTARCQTLAAGAEVAGTN